jgi:hypothetical protein
MQVSPPRVLRFTTSFPAVFNKPFCFLELGDGFDILAGDNSEIVFYNTHLNTAGTPADNTFSRTFSFWNIAKSIRSNCDKGKGDHTQITFKTSQPPTHSHLLKVTI